MAKETKTEALTAEEAAKQYTNSLVEKALKAEKVYATYTQEQVDKIVAAMALAGSEASLQLAKEAHDETGRGVVEDKDTKNHFATEYVYERIKNEKTVGIIGEDKVAGSIEIAAPLGVLAGIVPTTNPTSTTMFKILVALKTRQQLKNVLLMPPKSCMTRRLKPALLKILFNGLKHHPSQTREL